MESLKQAMLQHEIIFRNQVCELHRLYWTQKNLMNESNSWLSKESEEKKNSFFLFDKESLLAPNVAALEEFKGKSNFLLKNHQREFSLCLSDDDFIIRKGEDSAFYDQARNFLLSEENKGQLQKQKFSSSYLGIDDSYIDDSANITRKTKQARSMLFDLNLPHEDEGSEVKDDVDFSYNSDIKRQDSNITSSNSINHEGSEEDTSSSHAITQDEIFPYRNNKSSNTNDSVTTQLNSSQIEALSAAEILISIEQSDNIVTSNLSLYTSDSFECMTLQLSEVQSEDHSIMIEPNWTESSIANKTVKNERGVGLRRGRGFRDFQKEILPGLVTLSRHEICEDLHNIGYKLRNVRSRNVGDNWFVPVRSRRSKLRSVCRKRLNSP